MTIWKVEKCYTNDDNIIYNAYPYDLKGHLKACKKWYGIRGLKWCYLSWKRARNKAKKLNE